MAVEYTEQEEIQILRDTIEEMNRENVDLREENVRLLEELQEEKDKGLGYRHSTKFTNEIHQEDYPNLSAGTIASMLADSVEAIESIEVLQDKTIRITFAAEDMDEFYFNLPSAIHNLYLENKKQAVQPKSKEFMVEPGRQMATVVVNMFGGPGAGKTTAAHKVFTTLSEMGYSVQFASEKAKDYALVLTSHTASEEEVEYARFKLNGSLDNQQDMYDEQNHRVKVCLGQCDFVVTDSPAILSCVYLREDDPAKVAAFTSQAMKDFNEQFNFNMVVKRSGEYVQEGRVQDYRQALQIDKKMDEFLADNKIYHGRYDRDKVDVAVKNMVKTLERARAAFRASVPEPYRFPHPLQFQQNRLDGQREMMWSSEDRKMHITIREAETGWVVDYRLRPVVGESSKTVGSIMFYETFESAYEGCFNDMASQLSAANPKCTVVVDGLKQDSYKSVDELRAAEKNVFDKAIAVGSADPASKATHPNLAAPQKVDAIKLRK